MSKVHAKARKFAADCNLTIDEEAGFLELNGDYDLAVIVNLKEMKSSVEPSEQHSNVPAKVSDRPILTMKGGVVISLLTSRQFD